MAGEIASFLKDENPKSLGVLARGIELAIQKSFAESHVMVHKTAAEVRRRTEICVGIARQLRGDLGWSVHRIADTLPAALRANLDGAPWDPEHERAVWSPEDAPAAQLEPDADLAL